MTKQMEYRILKTSKIAAWCLTCALLLALAFTS